jgi:hypothetical protein
MDDGRGRAWARGQEAGYAHVGFQISRPGLSRRDHPHLWAVGALQVWGFVAVPVQTTFSGCVGVTRDNLLASGPIYHIYAVFPA